MFFHHERLALPTRTPIEIIDITERIQQIYSRHRVRDGQLTICSTHSTAFVALNEREPKLQQDMLDFLNRLAPSDADYRHNDNPVDGRLNAHSHLLGLFMNSSATILVSNGELLLGGWQSIFFLELDGPRDERTLAVQVSGVR
ncbi:secondary thiamine-phosphate synthase enzyme YjbQ [Thiocystis violascens]|uniref:Secondary thiamine-phosphate synthase enzyme n=1 Tax=Thiocystis violascens (strain ATCC 17096 / DSM 198 / 6111) TaxID=765911 RepID=I3YAD3_THIV6|nr:secondary thiamine-phosphate synthase enzyme YjbQ [Thiocystis violascens]AFL73951.1 secondary thiamine-phosphate synthase enzyme [Thiocystis violascens DSM 198]